MEIETNEFNDKFKGIGDRVKELIPLYRELRSDKGFNELYDAAYETLDTISSDDEKKMVNNFAKKLPKSRKGIDEYVKQILRDGDLEARKELANMVAIY